jgi:hypothetical protein
MRYLATLWVLGCAGLSRSDFGGLWRVLGAGRVCHNTPHDVSLLFTVQCHCLDLRS